MPTRLVDSFTNQLDGLTTSLNNAQFGITAIGEAIDDSWQAYNTAFGTTFTTLAQCMTDLYTEINGEDIS